MAGFDIMSPLQFLQNREDVEENNNAARNFNLQAAGEAMQFNSAEAAKNREFQREMSSTAYQRGTKDLLAAGLNPMLALSHAGASTPSGSSASGQAASASAGQPSGGHGGGDLLALSQAKLLDSQTKRTDAETLEIGERTKVHGAAVGEKEASADKLRQDVKESIERISNIQQQVRTGASTASHLDQQVTNLQAALPQIAATVRLLIAQAKQTGTMTGLTEEQTRDLRQKIHQNLPALENALKHMELRERTAGLPRKEQDMRTHDSAIGTASSILRSIIPFLP